jgi:group I intron endonuclease
MNNRINYLIPDDASSGIYKITTSDGHYYIGSTNSFKDRFKEHECTLRLRTHSNPHMTNRYHASADVWVYERVEEVPVDRLLIVEQMYLDKHCGNPLCMNINRSAIKPPSRKGVKLTDEQRCQLKKRVIRDRAAWIEKLRKANTGRVHSSEAKAKMRAARLGKKGKATPTTFQKGRVPWNKGKSTAVQYVRGCYERQLVCQPSR